MLVLATPFPAIAELRTTKNSSECRSANVMDRAWSDQPQRVEAHPTVDATTYPDLSNLRVVGVNLMLAGLFVLREIA
jgi:hypothetical protein